jgi:hypothetical protein|tara:strand:- start:332 stop:691 length:360 start_codon:yes stop_codon:yes gene_type:complete
MFTHYTDHDEAQTTNYKFAAMRQLQKNNSNYKSQTERYIVDKLESLRCIISDYAYSDKVMLNYRPTCFTFKVFKTSSVKKTISEVEYLLLNEYKFIKTDTVKGITYKVLKKDLIVALAS